MAVGTRDRILDAAAAVVVRDGSKGLTTKAIAAEAGLTEPALYTYFDSKDALCVAIARERIPCHRELAARITAQVGTGTVLGNLRAQAGDVLRYFLAAIPFEIMFWADPRLRAAGRDSTRAPDLLPPAMERYLRGEEALGRVPAGRPLRAVADGIVGALFQRAFAVTFAEESLRCEEADPLLTEVTDLAAAALDLDGADPSRPGSPS